MLDAWSRIHLFLTVRKIIFIKLFSRRKSNLYKKLLQIKFNMMVHRIFKPSFKRLRSAIHLSVNLKTVHSLLYSHKTVPFVYFFYEFLTVRDQINSIV